MYNNAEHSRNLVNGRLYASRTAKAVWGKKAKSGAWETLLANPKSYVNADGGYEKFLSIVSEYLLAHDDIPAGAGLDLGCGAGHSSQPLLLKPSIINPLYGIDPSIEMIRLARKRYPGISFRQREAAQLLDTFEPATFSVISSRGILASHLKADHWQEITVQVIALLKVGGIFIFDFLNTKWFEEHPKAREGRRHKFKYTPAQMETLIHEAAKQVSTKTSLEFLYRGRASIALMKKQGKIISRQI